MKKVMAFGAFDILHPGHLFYLESAKKLGDYLIVIVARDKIINKIKGRMPVFGEEDRLNIIQALHSVDKAVLGSLTNQYDCIKDYKPEIICLGYDQRLDETTLKNDLDLLGFSDIKIVRAKSKSPKKYKSSIFRKLC